jgi:hypothetical protein
VVCATATRIADCHALDFGCSSSEKSPSHSEEVDLTGRPPTDQAELGRLGSYFHTGGLVVVHAADRSRDGIWNALIARRTYGTSGPRILLFFERLDSEGEQDVVAQMGEEVTMSSPAPGLPRSSSTMKAGKARAT